MNKRDGIKCVYAGPEYFKKIREEEEKNEVKPEPPETQEAAETQDTPDTAEEPAPGEEKGYPENFAEDKRLSEQDINRLSDAAAVYAGPGYNPPAGMVYAGPGYNPSRPIGWMTLDSLKNNGSAPPGWMVYAGPSMMSQFAANAKPVPEEKTEQKEITPAWTCPRCGNNNPDGKFCRNCGTIRPEAREEWICSRCGAKNKGKFCTDCGCEKDMGTQG